MCGFCIQPQRGEILVDTYLDFGYPWGFWKPTGILEPYKILINPKPSIQPIPSNPLNPAHRNQLHLKNQRAIRANGRTYLSFAISQLRRYEKPPLAAGIHQL